MTIINHISETAVIDETAKVWHGVFVGDRTIIGKNTTIGSLANIDRDVIIGKNCKIEGSVYIPPLTEIGDNVFIGPGVVLTNDKYPPSEDPKQWEGVIVEDNAVICASSTLMAGVVIRKNSLVCASSLVTKNTEEDTVVWGIPAKYKETREEYEKRRWI